MSERSKSPSKMPVRNDADAATQLTILLDAATAILAEEFKRGESLDTKARNLATITGAFFAVVQAVVVGLVSEGLTATATHPDSPFIPWLGAAGIAASLFLVVALRRCNEVWKLREAPALEPSTLRDYRDAARDGNPTVGTNLVNAYADIAEGRRAVNQKRAEALDRATVGCGIAMFFIGIELVLAFAAVVAL